MVKNYDALSFYEKKLHDTIINDDGILHNKLGRELTELYKQDPVYFIPRGWHKTVMFTSRVLFLDYCERPLGMTKEEQNHCIVNVTSVILHGFRTEFQLGNFWEK